MSWTIPGNALLKAFLVGGGVIQLTDAVVRPARLWFRDGPATEPAARRLPLRPSAPMSRSAACDAPPSILPAEEYASWLQRTGLDEATAHFVAALDVSIARGDLETSSQDLAQLLGRPATPLTEVAGAAHELAVLKR